MSDEGWQLIRPEHREGMDNDPRKYGVAWKHEALAQRSRGAAKTAEVVWLRKMVEEAFEEGRISHDREWKHSNTCYELHTYTPEAT